MSVVAVVTTEKSTAFDCNFYVRYKRNALYGKCAQRIANAMGGNAIKCNALQHQCGSNVESVRTA